MSAATTIDLIQAVNRTATGVRWAPAFAQYPLAIESARLPMVLTWPAAAQWERQQFGSKVRSDRVYDLMCFVEPLGQSTLGSRSTLAVTLLDSLYATWTALDANGYPTALAQPVNDGDAQVTVMWDGEYPQDTGLNAELQIGATVCAGFTIRLRVRELT